MASRSNKKQGWEGRSVSVAATPPEASYDKNPFSGWQAAERRNPLLVGGVPRRRGPRIFADDVAKNRPTACMPARFGDDLTLDAGVTRLTLTRKPDTTMAKSSRRTDSSSTAWLTAAEQRVLDSTVGSSLATATRNQLQAAIKQTRTLRDKWRDLFNRQSLTTKKGASRTNDPANTRSLEKAELFGAAVKRLEARIEELAEGISAAVGGGKRGGGKPSRTAAAKPASKAVRQAGHRATRSSIRETLSEAVAGINAAGRRLLGAAEPAAKQPKAGKPATGGKAATPVAAARPAAKTGKPATRPTKSPPSKKARQAGKLRTLAATGTGQAIHFDPKQQRSAKARGTVKQLKLDGLSTRRRGHTLAAGKRKQARRDGR